MTNARRCGARAKHGGLCRQFAFPNGRCKLHGGWSTGPRRRGGRDLSKQNRLRLERQAWRRSVGLKAPWGRRPKVERVARTMDQAIEVAGRAIEVLSRPAVDGLPGV